MKQPLRFVDSLRPNHVCLLRKLLYDLKQSPQERFKKLFSHLMLLSFLASKTDISLFFHYDSSLLIFLLLYVDDILILSLNLSSTLALIRSLQSTFPLHNLGPT